MARFRATKLESVPQSVGSYFSDSQKNTSFRGRTKLSSSPIDKKNGKSSAAVLGASLAVAIALALGISVVTNLTMREVPAAEVARAGEALMLIGKDSQNVAVVYDNIEETNRHVAAQEYVQKKEMEEINSAINKNVGSMGDIRKQAKVRSRQRNLAIACSIVAGAVVIGLVIAMVSAFTTPANIPTIKAPSMEMQPVDVRLENGITTLVFQIDENTTLEEVYDANGVLSAMTIKEANAWGHNEKNLAVEETRDSAGTYTRTIQMLGADGNPTDSIVTKYTEAGDPPVPTLVQQTITSGGTTETMNIKNGKVEVVSTTGSQTTTSCHEISKLEIAQVPELNHYNENQHYWKTTEAGSGTACK
eukprot:GHVT01087104.1.p1 GENE.GHVT01087104.1~~GHVT01087104.1.p1  ORF type:complete len:361 (+),score=44.20 GHVT01087104.1:223-1305(+)